MCVCVCVCVCERESVPSVLLRSYCSVLLLLFCFVLFCCYSVIDFNFVNISKTDIITVCILHMLCSCNSLFSDLSNICPTCSILVTLCFQICQTSVPPAVF